MLLSLCSLLIAFLAPPDDAVRVAAELSADTLTVGETYEIEIEAELADGWNGKDQPPLIVQLDYPACLEPTDKVLSGRALAKNQFIAEPYEYVLKNGEREIDVRLASSPTANDTIGVNIVGYLRNDDGDTWLVRKRLTLPVAVNAKAMPADASKSDWSAPSVLQIGDKLPDLALPQANGEMVNFANYAKGKNMVITTYRAHW